MSGSQQSRLGNVGLMGRHTFMYTFLECNAVVIRNIRTDGDDDNLGLLLQFFQNSTEPLKRSFQPFDNFTGQHIRLREIFQIG